MSYGDCVYKVHSGQYLWNITQVNRQLAGGSWRSQRIPGSLPWVAERGGIEGTSPLQATASVIRMNRNIPDIFSEHQTQLHILQKVSQVNVNIFTGQTKLLVTLKTEGWSSCPSCDRKLVCREHWIFQSQPCLTPVKLPLQLCSNTWAAPRTTWGL